MTRYPKAVVIVIEVKIQNATLAIAIAAGLLNNPGIAVPAAVDSLFAYATPILAIFYGRSSAQKIYQKEKS